VINAFTTKEHTCFYVKVLHQHLDLAVTILTDIFFNSLFDRAEIEKERNVIIQEINMVKDTPDDYIQDLFNQSYFANHPLGYTVLGQNETVQNFTRERIVDFFRREYLVPQKIIISAAGNIEHNSLVDKIAGRFHHLKEYASDTAGTCFKPRREVCFHFRDLEQVHICMGAPGLSQTDENRHTLYILNAILGGSMSSRLFQEIREKNGLAYSVFSFIAAFNDVGIFGIYMGIVQQTLDSAMQIVQNEIKTLKDTLIEDTELTCAKEQIKGNMLLALESSDSRMSRLAKCELYYNDFIPVESILSSVDKVRADDVRDLARSILRNECCTYTFLGPATEKTVSPSVLHLN